MSVDLAMKCKLAIKSIFMGLCTVSVTGCNISVPQAESSYRFMKDVIFSGDVSSQEQQAVWLASVGGRGAVLRPYLSGEFTVFANADGDAITFDGWTVRSVVGFGLAGPISISGKHGNRTFFIDRLKTSTQCDPWHLKGLTWRQTCANGDGEIVLNQDGNIELILMSLGENLGIVTLRVAK